MDISIFVDKTYDLFSTFDKPLVATKVDHCDECRDHNDEIGGVNCRDLSPEQIGTVCWGISSFLTQEAMGYYIPRLIELAVTAEDDKHGTPYMCSFINQIGLSSSSDQFALFSKAQRLAVRDTLFILKDTYMDTLIEHCWEDEIDGAITQWGT
ncbi:hypothetical protein [Motilimonas pumila]|uniref:Uncharacterized protein n=1 Tax=Motilimonas pumila TaxID=2303987 RepID=A0A418Y961_9GAMM|nr:hypothetical protein [Motilimonas pumila]RJG36505.1 hypothetical protein D1Z90_20360 [Motilimonas pumila]